MAKQALLLIDIQNDYFEGGKYPLVGINEAARNASRLLEKFRELTKANGEVFIVHVRHEFDTDPSQAPFFGRDTEGAATHPSVQNQNDEVLITKNHPNAFVGTELQKFFDSNGVKDLVIVGAMTHMCVQGTTRAASELGYNVTVVTDATATRDLQYKDTLTTAKQVAAAVFATLEFGYATLTTTDEAIAKLG